MVLPVLVQVQNAGEGSVASVPLIWSLSILLSAEFQSGQSRKQNKKELNAIKTTLKTTYRNYKLQLPNYKYRNYTSPKDRTGDNRFGSSLPIISVLRLKMASCVQVQHAFSTPLAEPGSFPMDAVGAKVLRDQNPTQNQNSFGNIPHQGSKQHTPLYERSSPINPGHAGGGGGSGSAGSDSPNNHSEPAFFNTSSTSSSSENDDTSGTTAK